MISRPGSRAVGMNAEQPPARPERPHERRYHARGLELDGHACAIGLRGDHKVVVRAHLALARDDVVEQELEVVAVDDEHDGALVDRVAGFRAVAGLPVAAEERLESGDLLAEIAGGRPRQRHLVPNERGGGGNRLRRQPRRLGIIHVGDDEHGRRVLVEPVRHLVERQPHVLEADLFARQVERHRREAAVHIAHDARHDRAVAHAGIEHAQGRRLADERWRARG